MPKYRVKPGYRHGVGKAYGPGDIVELTEYEAGGFLDKLELVGIGSPDDSDPSEVESPPDPSPPGPPQGGDRDVVGDLTVEEIREWLATNPEPEAVISMHAAERAGKKRSSALKAMEDYLKGAE